MITVIVCKTFFCKIFNSKIKMMGLGVGEQIVLAIFLSYIIFSYLQIYVAIAIVSASIFSYLWSVKHYLLKMSIRLLTLQAQELVKFRLRSRSRVKIRQYSNVNALKTAIRQAWEEIDQETIENLILIENLMSWRAHGPSTKLISYRE